MLQSIADALRRQSASLAIEGNCDELGTTEYNLALGEERARAAKSYLVHLGVPPNRIATISYGSQRPKYPGHDDDARARNRRDDLIVRSIGGVLPGNAGAARTSRLRALPGRWAAFSGVSPWHGA